MNLYNTRTRKIENFIPLHDKNVTLYSCGPTVYDFTHIGHLRTYISTDILKRTLTMKGYTVKHIMNITDVGHLSGDDDTGEDKLEKGAKKFGKSIEEVVAYFTDFFMKSLKKANIALPDNFPKATEHIDDMITLIKILEEIGCVYETKEGVYFDVTKFSHYGALSGQHLDDKKQQVRADVNIDPDKKHPADFALWLKRIGRFKDHTMHWDSPWGDGFPGWHIECSAMSMKYLGETIDIHSGGVDHIPVHHENEIAQSEAATGREFVRFWFHCEFLMIEGKKMSKSLGNLLTIEDIEKKGFSPAALRLLFLQTHYRQEMNFTWDALAGSQNALNRLREALKQIRSQTQRTQLSEEKLEKVDDLRKKFQSALANDLQTPQALAVLWEALKSNIPSEDKYDFIMECDQVLGLELALLNDQEISIPDNVQKIAAERFAARAAGDFDKADRLRAQVSDMGYEIIDDDASYYLRKKL